MPKRKDDVVDQGSDLIAKDPDSNNKSDTVSKEVSEISDDMKIKVGDKELTIGELKSGWMKNADYTQKTQALAKERKKLEEEMRQLEDYRLIAQWFEDGANSEKAELVRKIIQGEEVPSLQESAEFDEDDPYYKYMKTIEEKVNQLNQNLTRFQDSVSKTDEERALREVQAEIEQTKKKYEWLTESDLDKILAIAEAQGGADITKVADEYVSSIEEHAKRKREEYLKEKEKEKETPIEGGNIPPPEPDRKLSLIDGSAKKAFMKTLQQAFQQSTKEE